MPTPDQSLAHSPSSPLYPKKFNDLKKPPKEIWIKGELPPQETPIVGIVGTRQPSEWGKKLAFDFAHQLTKAGIWTVSGLARGIDAAAHEGSIGKTIAVIGSGLNHVYPAENKSLASKISVITEYPADIKPHAYNFPQRNRLVAALSDILLVIEAPEKSGTLITVNYVLELKKKCLVVAGPLDRENYKGSNRLIKEGKGELCLGIEEILAFFKKSSPAITPLINDSKYTNPEELNILRLLQKEDLSFDQLTLLTGLATNGLNVHLMSLVLKRAIREYAGKIYGKVSNYS